MGEVRVPEGALRVTAAKVNCDLGELSLQRGCGIEAAANQVMQGAYDLQFVEGIFQTGSRASTNMNANEVIGTLPTANPNDEVRRGQSSNDVIPSAIHIAAAHGAAVEACGQRIRAALKGIYELPLGGTAVGAGLNARTRTRTNRASRTLAPPWLACVELRKTYTCKGIYQLWRFLRGRGLPFWNSRANAKEVV